MLFETYKIIVFKPLASFFFSSLVKAISFLFCDFFFKNANIFVVVLWFTFF